MDIRDSSSILDCAGKLLTQIVQFKYNLSHGPIRKRNGTNGFEGFHLSFTEGPVKKLYFYTSYAGVGTVRGGDKYDRAARVSFVRVGKDKLGTLEFTREKGLELILQYIFEDHSRTNPTAPSATDESELPDEAPPTGDEENGSAGTATSRGNGFLNIRDVFSILECVQKHLTETIRIKYDTPDRPTSVYDQNSALEKFKITFPNGPVRELLFFSSFAGIGSLMGLRKYEDTASVTVYRRDFQRSGSLEFTREKGLLLILEYIFQDRPEAIAPPIGVEENGLASRAALWARIGELAHVADGLVAAQCGT
jgi:hypothetical protein